MSCTRSAEPAAEAKKAEGASRVALLIFIIIIIIIIIIIRVHYVQKYTRAILLHAALCHS